MRARLLGVGVVGLLAMLAAARAHADWREVPVLTEPLNDVLDVWGPEMYSVGYRNSSSAGAYLVLSGDKVRTLSGRESVGTFYDPNQDCFVSLAADGYRATMAADGGACGGINPNQPIPPPYTLDETFKRMKHTPGGGSAALVAGNGYHVMVVSDGGLDAPSTAYTVVTRAELEPLPALPYSVARLGNRVHVLLGLENTIDAPLTRWGAIAPKAESEWTTGDTAAGQSQAVALLPVDGLSVPLAVVATRSALLQGSASNLSERPLQVVQRLAPGQRFVDLSMTVGAGSDAGEGFGMALVQQPGEGLRVLSPVPADSRADAGTVWSTRMLPPSLAPVMADVRQVACHGAAFCVLTAPGKTEHNVFVYSNVHEPVLAVDGGPGVRVDAGWVEFDEDSAATLSLGAPDPDGDPVRVTATLQNLERDRWTVGLASTVPGEPVEVPVTTKRVCERTRVGRFTVRASDGWSAHDLEENVDVYVKHTRQPLPPAVTQTDGGEVPRGSGFAGALEAGGAELTLTSTDPDSDDGCRWERRLWTQVSPDGPTLERVDGGTARIRPLKTFCEASGRDFSFTLKATDQGGLEASRTLTVRQQPWGAPEPVFAASPVATPPVEPTGASVTVLPDNRRHACQDEPAFPGVVTSWWVTRPDGSAPGEDYSVQRPDGGPELQAFPVEAAGLVLSARSCQPESTLTVRAAHRVNGAGGGPTPLGPESQRQVRIPPGWPELSRGVVTVSSAGDAGTLNVTSALQCASERGLSAVLRLSPEEPGGTQLSPEAVALPSEWTPPRDVECGRYALRAVLKEGASGGEGPEHFVRELVLPGAGVRVEALAPVEMKAECGRGASLALTDLVRPAPGFCQTPEYTWSDGSETAIEQVSAPDKTLTLVTKSQELDALIGKWVRGTVEASKGEARARLPAEVRITTEPFVQVERRTELPAAAETGLVGVLVRLTNTTGCDVSDVIYAERLEGLSFVEGSARLDGVAVETNEGEEKGEDEEKGKSRLSVKLPLLAAGATRTLSYVARPHLLGEGRMTGEAFKNEVLISMSDASEPPREGCGCTSAGAAPMLLVLALLGALTRRRPTARS